MNLHYLNIPGCYFDSEMISSVVEHDYVLLGKSCSDADEQAKQKREFAEANTVLYSVASNLWCLIAEDLCAASFADYIRSSIVTNGLLTTVKVLSNCLDVRRESSNIPAVQSAISSYGFGNVYRTTRFMKRFALRKDEKLRDEALTKFVALQSSLADKVNDIETQLSDPTSETSWCVTNLRCHTTKYFADRHNESKKKGKEINFTINIWEDWLTPGSSWLGGNSVSGIAYDKLREMDRARRLKKVSRFYTDTYDNLQLKPDSESLETEVPVERYAICIKTNVHENSCYRIYSFDDVSTLPDYFGFVAPPSDLIEVDCTTLRFRDKATAMSLADTGVVKTRRPAVLTLKRISNDEINQVNTGKMSLDEFYKNGEVYYRTEMLGGEWLSAVECGKSAHGLNFTSYTLCAIAFYDGFVWSTEKYSWPGVKIIAPCAVSAAKISDVPKKADARRTIGMEHPLRMSQQKQVANIADALHGQDIHTPVHDQTVNRRLAKIAAQVKYATVDSSDASDRVLWAIVKRVYPEWYVKLLQATRTEYGKVPNYGLIPIYSAGLMGCGWTFITESSYHYNVGLLAEDLAKLDGVQPVQRCVRPEDIPIEPGSKFTSEQLADLINENGIVAYGDDVLLPEEYYPYFVKALELLGGKVNMSKSYAAGDSFRESCGTDVRAYRTIGGYQTEDITPIYWPRTNPDLSVNEKGELQNVLKVYTQRKADDTYNVTNSITTLLALQHELYYYAPKASAYLTILLKNWFPDMTTSPAGCVEHTDLWGIVEEGPTYYYPGNTVKVDGKELVSPVKIDAWDTEHPLEPANLRIRHYTLKASYDAKVRFRDSDGKYDEKSLSEARERVTEYLYDMALRSPLNSQEVGLPHPSVDTFIAFPVYSYGLI